jgi:hypothetical protein
MVSDEGERKLAAILSADVVGYSKLMADDERATVNTLTGNHIWAEQLAHDAYDHAMELHSPEEELLKLKRAAAAEQTS